MCDHRYPHQRLYTSLRLGSLSLAALFAVAASLSAADPIVIDFEDENLDVWTIVDEPPENLGQQGPSTWDILDSELGFEGQVLTQGSNIWGEPEDHMLLGTIAYYNVQKFDDFRLEVDVIANDNDGMGFVWGYQDLDQHYRFQLMNDRWPDTPTLDGFNGPYLIAHKRISNSSPWYEVLGEPLVDDYIPYTQGFEEINHWVLEVVDGAFTITTIDSFGDENVLTGFDDDYLPGYVGIQLYAQSGVEFDNFTITPLNASVPGDFNGDGLLDATDIDLLTMQVNSGAKPAEFDVNNDGNVDQSDRDVWVRDLKKTYFGDANLDGVFNTADFLSVFQKGEYEDGVAQNSSWATGDWDGDLDFSSGDFVKAFQDGGFEKGPRAAQAVPEPMSPLLTLTGLLALLYRRRHRRQ